MLISDDDVSRMLRQDLEYYGARKIREQEIRSTYASGESSRLNPVPRGVNPMGSDADSHYPTERSYFLHVERGRAAVRNHPLVEQGINRLISNLRLDGFQLDVSSGDPEVDRAQKEDWRFWTGETQAGQSLCDYEGTRSFQQIARQSFFSRVQDGDLLHLPLTSGTIQTWESHHIRSPFGQRHRIVDFTRDGIVHGAEVRGGRIVAYWVTPFGLGPHQSLSKRGQARRIPVFDSDGNKATFYGGFRHRWQQRRGISRLSAPRDAMTGFDDLNYANIKSALRRALISWWLEDSGTVKQDWTGGNKPSVPQSGDRYSIDVGLGIQQVTVEQVGQPAQIMSVPSGKTVKGINDDLPPEAFFEHSSLLLNMLSVNIDLPLMFLLLDGSKVNFHGGRMIWDQVKLRLMQIQQDEIQALWAPTYEWRTRLKLTPGQPFFDPALAAAVKRGVDPFRYQFRPRGWPYPKPAEDVASETKAEQGNVKSRRAIMNERGVDIEEEDRIIITDRSRFIRQSLDEAVSIVTDYPDLDLNAIEIAKEIRYGSNQVNDQAEIIANQQYAAEAKNG